MWEALSISTTATNKLWFCTTCTIIFETYSRGWTALIYVTRVQLTITSNYVLYLCRLCSKLVLPLATLFINNGKYAYEKLCWVHTTHYSVSVLCDTIGFLVGLNSAHLIFFCDGDLWSVFREFKIRWIFFICIKCIPTCLALVRLTLCTKIMWKMNIWPGSAVSVECPNFRIWVRRCSVLLPQLTL